MKRRFATPALAALILILVTGLTVPGAPAVAAPARPTPPGVTGTQPGVYQALQRDLKLTRDQVTKRLVVQAGAPAIEQSLRIRLGHRFGGAWVSADGSAVTVAVTSAAAAPLVRAAGAVPVAVARSQQQLDAIKSILDRRKKAAPTAVTSWYVDVVGNRVVVRARPGQARAAQAFVARAGAPAGVVRVVVADDRPQPLFDVRGGDAYHIGGSRCSVGFSVQGGFVTAGHCAALTSGALTGVNGAALGTWGGYSFPGQDYAWVRTNSSWTPQPVVNTYNGSTTPVGGSQEAPVGAMVCRSGSTTGWHCGTIGAKNTTVVYPQGAVAGLTQTNVCAEPGDSGGSFISGDQAQGVTSGGSGDCTSGGTTYFQPVNPILATYGLSLVTTSAVPFSQWLLHTGTALGYSAGGAWQLGFTDWDRDGIPDLAGIVRRNTGSGTVEVHIMSGASGFQQFNAHYATGFGAIASGDDDKWEFGFTDWDRDGIPDLAGIIKRNNGSGTTELHILSGASGFQQFILHTATGLGYTAGGGWQFSLTDWDRDGVPDLAGIVRRNTGSGTVEVHILSGASGFTQFNAHYATGFAAIPAADDGRWELGFTDWDRDGVPDLAGILRRNTGSGTAEVHIVSGASGFQQFNAHYATLFGQVAAADDDQWTFGFTDWNRDGRPDLAGIIKRGTGSGTTEVHVLRG